MQLFQDFETALTELFSHLNWTYILMYTFVLYGISNKKEFIWYNKLMDKNSNLSLLKEWIAGFVVAAFFITFRSIGPDGMDSEYISALLRSYIIVLIFNSVLSKKISKIDDGDDKTDKSDSLNNKT